MEMIDRRYGRTTQEVKQRWCWENPWTVVKRIRFNGIHPSGKREYLVYWAKRKHGSKRSRMIESLKARGAKYGGRGN